MSDRTSSSPAMRRAVYEVVRAAEQEKLDAYLAVDLAHVVMLYECGIVQGSVAAMLSSGLRRAYTRLAAEPRLAMEQQSLLFAVENLLRQEVGDTVAGHLQTGRSRLDQSEAVRRLYYRNLLLDVAQELVGLLAAMLQRAHDWEDVLTAGWTHLQHSQPWNLGHYMLAHFDRTCRDMERVMHCLDRTDLSALGGAAMAGTDWPIDRDRAAFLLGHPGTISNSLDASTQQADYPAEAAAALSIVACNLARWAADFYVWSSSEFGLLQLDDAHCGTSSVMPQKRNPIALARIRALAGQSVGWLPAQLAIIKSPGSADCDSFYASGTANASLRELIDVIGLGTEVIQCVRLDHKRCAQALEGSWCTLSAVADRLVRNCSVDFRSAHAIVAQLARTLQAQGRTPESMHADDLSRAARLSTGQDLTLPPEELRTAIAPRSFARSRTSAGGTAPMQIQVQLERSTTTLARWKEEVDARRERIALAALELERTIDALMR